jgi:hypothetical protein
MSDQSKPDPSDQPERSTSNHLRESHSDFMTRTMQSLESEARETGRYALLNNPHYMLWRSHFYDRSTLR